MRRRIYRNPFKVVGQVFDKISSLILNFFVSALDIIFLPIQRFIGIKGMAYVFILPNLIIFSVFILFPMISNFFYTFTGGDNLFLQDRPYVGTANIERLFDCDNFFDSNTCTEDLFSRSVINTFFFVITQVAWMILLSLITAVVLDQNIVARGFFRSVFFYPVLLSPIVVGLLWRWILQENGILNAFIVNWGGEKIQFLTNAAWARFWVIVISIWSLMGFYTLILLAGLQSIPHDLYEASAMDGASKWHTFRTITLPLLMPTMLVVIVLSVIRAVQVFDTVWSFSGGGPGSATTYLVQYIYQNGFASATKQYGLAAAASLVMASVLVVFTIMQLRLRGREGMA